MQRMFWKIFTLVFFLNLAAYAQQQEPLGDIARQYRDKLAAEEAAGTAPKMYTNQDIPPAQQVGTPEPSNESRPGARPWAASRGVDEGANEQRGTERSVADQRAAVEWRNRIQAQEARLADLEARIDQLNARIHYQGGTAQYEGPYTRTQARAMERLDQMQQLLNWQKQRLEQMQEAARHAGMHTAVYEP